MSDAVIAPVSAENNVKSSWVTLPAVHIALMLLIVIAGMMARNMIIINHDVANNLDISRHVLDGQKFYKDIFEVNPPTVFWMGMIPVLLDRFIGNQVLSFYIFAGVLSALVLVSCTCLVARQSETARPVSRFLLIIIALSLFFIDSYDLGQREWFITVLLLPYLFLPASAKVSWPWRFMIGMAVGVAVMIKPYFVLVPLAVEAVRIANRQIVWWAPTAERVGMVVVGLCVVAMILPMIDDFKQVVGWAHLAYGDYNEETSIWQRVNPWHIVWLGSGLIAVIGACRHPQFRKDILLSSFPACYAAALACVATLFLQEADFPYHSVPVTILSLPFVGMAIAALGSKPQLQRLTSLRMVIVYAAILGVMGSTSFSYDYNVRNVADRDYADVVKGVSLVHGRKIMTISTSMDAFPLTVVDNLDYVSAFTSLWMLPHVQNVRDGVWGSDSRTLADAQHLADITSTRVASELEGKKPDLVLVRSCLRQQGVRSDTLDLLKVLNENPEFTEAWAQYRLLSDRPPFKDYERNACMQIYVRR